MYVVRTKWEIIENNECVDLGSNYYIAFNRGEVIDLVNELKRQNHDTNFEVVYDETPDYYGTWYSEQKGQSYFTIEVYQSVNYDNGQ